MAFGIYIHWPYCLSKCPYCDFYKEVRKNVAQADIVTGYLKELDFYHNMTSHRQVTSVFFGGGTPSLMEPQQIERLLNYISQHWSIASDVEISLEANPNSHYPEMFSALRKAGINRLSLGVQALNDDDLRFLGRTHTLSQAYRAIDEVLKNFDNHSIDLIYARPHQTLSSWQKELQEAVSFGTKHLSLYQLTIEEGTVFARKHIQALEDEQATEMYLATEDILASYGYQKYEVSNYAQSGYESKHNLIYWTGEEYIGVGPSAQGRLTGFKGNLKQNSGDGNSRINNINSAQRTFYATTYPCQLEELTAEERAEEMLLMGLRLTKGIDKTDFYRLCGIKCDDFVNQTKLKELVQDGWLENTSSCLRATKKGFPLLNILITELVSQ